MFEGIDKKEKKKVGILTWFYVKNYGARAHSYALYSILKEMGYDVEMINYTPLRAIIYDAKDVLSKNPIVFLKRVFQLIFIYTHPDPISKSKRVFNAKGINRLKYDRIILGSDEIFNVLHPCFSDVYMGVGLDPSKTLTYAVSCGSSYSNCISELCRQSILSLRDISVRDKYTKDFIKDNTGRESMVVLDPTLLIDENYEISGKIVKDDYVLIYAFSSLNSEKDTIVEYAKTNGLAIVRIGYISGDSKWIDYQFENLSLNEWKWMFSNANLVVTDSYHGTIFAIKNHRKFVVVEREEKTSKIKGLFEQLEISFGYYENSMEIEKGINCIDYKEIEGKIVELRKLSIEYLTANL